MGPIKTKNWQPSWKNRPAGCFGKCVRWPFWKGKKKEEAPPPSFLPQRPDAKHVFFLLRLIQGGPEITEQSIQSIFRTCSNQQLFSSLCWIEHLFPIIIASRSSKLVENFLFYETFLMDCHFRDLPDFQCFEARWEIIGKSQNWQSIRSTHKIKSFLPNLMIFVLL